MPAESWRVFGLAGAGAALLFYLLEYAPAPLSFRLEVNHPIYALAFFLGGEFLCRAQRLLFIRVRRKSDQVWAAACATALAVIGAAIFLGPMEWHAMRQPFMQRLHEEIAEFQPIKLGISGDKYFEVLAGLKAGDEVVTGPYNSVRTLADGDVIKIEAPKTADGK